MKMGPTHLKRYKDVAMLFLKYGNSELATMGGYSASTDVATEKEKCEAENLAEDLEKLGPTFVKIGQLLSTRSDLVSPAYMDALSRLQDNVDPVDYEEIEKVVNEQLGIRISKAFQSFDEIPVGSASLGQVHRAVLRNGRQVAVKVQRPKIREEIMTDLESLQEIADFLDEHTEFGKKYETGRILSEFRGTLIRELDYLKEAHNLAQLRINLKEFDRLLIPEVIEDYTTSCILTMDYVAGAKITSLSGAVLADVEGDQLAECLFRAYLQQILVDGFFHADPHPGNILLTTDHRLGILDLGMVGRLNQRLRDQLVHLLAGISHGEGLQTAEAALRIGEARNGSIDKKNFINDIEEIVGSTQGSDLKGLQIGTVVMKVMRSCAKAGLRIPAEINLLGKTLMNLDRIGITLSPRFDPSAAIRRNLETISSARVKDSLSIASILGAASETKDFLGALPRRMNDILELVATNKMQLKIDSLDEHKLMMGIQKIANRITIGLILGALIVGSSMLARVDTAFRIWGYPGLAFIFFLLAVVGAVVLLVQIFFKDE